MSDIKEPTELGYARQEEKLFEFKLSMKKMARRKLELQYEMDKICENEVATQKEMAKLEEILKNRRQ